MYKYSYILINGKSEAHSTRNLHTVVGMLEQTLVMLKMAINSWFCWFRFCCARYRRAWVAFWESQRRSTCDAVRPCVKRLHFLRQQISEPLLCWLATLNTSAGPPSPPPQVLGNRFGDVAFSLRLFNGVAIGVQGMQCPHRCGCPGEPCVWKSEGPFGILAHGPAPNLATPSWLLAQRRMNWRLFTSLRVDVKCHFNNSYQSDNGGLICEKYRLLCIFVFALYGIGIGYCGNY